MKTMKTECCPFFVCSWHVMSLHPQTWIQEQLLPRWHQMTEPVLQEIVPIFLPIADFALFLLNQSSRGQSRSSNLLHCRHCTFSTEPVLQGIIQIIQPTSLDALHFFLYICTTITLPKNCASLFALPVVLACGLIVLMVLVLVLVYGTICLQSKQPKCFTVSWYTQTPIPTQETADAVIMNKK